MTSPSAVWTVEGLSGSVAGISCGPGLGSGAGRVDSGTASSSAARVSATSATIASPIGARAASSGSLVIATSSRPRAAARRGCGGSRGRPSCPPTRIRSCALQGLGDRADRRRQDAAEVGMALREADPPAAGGGRRPDRQALALDQADRRLPAAAGVDVGAGDEDGVAGGVEPLGERAHRLGVGDGASRHRAADRVARRRPRRPRRTSRPSAARRRPAPSAAARPGGRRGPAPAARPRRGPAHRTT